MGFCRQEYWNEFLFPSPRDLLHPGTEPMSLVSPALAWGFFTPKPSEKPCTHIPIHLSSLESTMASWCISCLWKYSIIQIFHKFRVSLQMTHVNKPFFSLKKKVIAEEIFLMRHSWLTLFFLVVLLLRGRYREKQEVKTTNTIQFY